MAKKKTFVEDIERTLYDIKDADNSVYKSESGLTEDIIRDISAHKGEKLNYLSTILTRKD